MDKIILNQLEFHGRIGVKDAERTVGQWLVVNLELSCDLSTAAASDDLRDTVSYSSVARTVHEVGTTVTCYLLEYMAAVMIEAILVDHPQVKAVRLQLFKRPPPVAIPIHSAGVELYRERA